MKTIAIDMKRFKSVKAFHHFKSPRTIVVMRMADDPESIYLLCLGFAKKITLCRIDFNEKKPIKKPRGTWVRLKLKNDDMDVVLTECDGTDPDRMVDGLFECCGAEIMSDEPPIPTIPDRDKNGFMVLRKKNAAQPKPISIRCYGIAKKDEIAQSAIQTLYLWSDYADIRHYDSATAYDLCNVHKNIHSDIMDQGLREYYDVLDETGLIDPIKNMLFVAVYDRIRDQKRPSPHDQIFLCNGRYYNSVYLCEESGMIDAEEPYTF